MAFLTSQLAQRVAPLEADGTKLKSQIEATQTTQPWWEQIAGTFQHDPMYEEAMQLGRQYRQSSRLRKPTQEHKWTFLMVVLDTDHMSLLEWADARDSTPARARLAALSPEAAPSHSAERRSIPQNQPRGARLSFCQRKSAICGR
jgi:hypothetical protein